MKNILLCKDLPQEIQDRLSLAQKAKIDFALMGDIPIVIAGNQAKTGKTTLVNALKEIGAQAYEPFEFVEIIV